MKSRSNHLRTFKGFVALERNGGPIIWGTLRPDAAACRAMFERWNPGMVPVIRRVRLHLDQPPA
jgi:hypothetical protein